MEKFGADDTSVRVALRVRPENAREKIDMCKVCTSVDREEGQVSMGKDKAFTFDFVFDRDSTQDDIYNTCSSSLIEGCLEGYNATIFAYGQTGAGKTYTMGTGFDLEIVEENVGIIPRAVDHLFKGIERRRQAAVDEGTTPPEFKVNSEFMELYNEEIIDLLDTSRDPSERGKKSHIKIHEDAAGGIYTVGVTTRTVGSLEDTMQCLKIGALSRTTASTNMNSQSSRSHAIFTLHIKQQRLVKSTDETAGETTSEFETLTAKFHFVDLAGSERLKRTGATGERAKEGISINCGLLALGNVISALGDKAKRGCHVPYRDSKLTRMLQDSLGGNSRTVMIACVSPVDRDFMETLNTLKYANRARNIKNKVTVNQDKTSKQIAALKDEIKNLTDELLEYKSGKRSVNSDGVEVVNDMMAENAMLVTENKNLVARIKALQETANILTEKNTQLLAERASMNITNIGGDASQDEISKLIQGYIKEIEDLRGKLIYSEAMCETLRKQASRAGSRHGSATSPMPSPRVASRACSVLNNNNEVDDILELARKDIEGMKQKIKGPKNSDDADKDINEAEDDVISEASHHHHHHLNGISEHVDEDEDEAGGGEELAGEDDEDDLHPDEEDVDDITSSEDDNEASPDGKSPRSADETLHEDLAELSCEISIKQKLIDELEQSQKRLHTLKHQYEEKLVLLQTKIKDIETERDTVLANLAKVNTTNTEKKNTVKAEYQKKLNDLQSEMKKLQAAKREHAKLLKNKTDSDRQLKQLQAELNDMKKTKCKLLKQVKEESKRNKAQEAKKDQEIMQLRKEQRSRDSKIKALASEKTQKETILKRKQEELETLRRRQVPMSKKAAGRVGRYTYPAHPPAAAPARPGGPPRLSQRNFSSKAAKAKWDSMEKSVKNVVTKKQTITHMERDMNTWLKEREKLGRKLEKLHRKREEAKEEGKDDQYIADLDYEIENLMSRLDRAQDNIQDCQSNIMELVEMKDEDTLASVGQVSLDEAKYLIEHLVNMVIQKGLYAAQKESENKELNLKLGKVKRHNTFHYSLLQYVMQSSNADIEIEDDLVNRHREEVSDSDSETASSSGSDFERYLDAFLPEQASTPVAAEKAGAEGESEAARRRREKARRKTATTEDLLFANAGPQSIQLLPLPKLEEESPQPEPPRPAPPVAIKSELPSPVSFKPVPPVSVKSEESESALMPPPRVLKPVQGRRAERAAAAEQKDQQPPNQIPVLKRSESMPSPGPRRRAFTSARERETPDPSPMMKRKVYSRQSSLDRDSERNGDSPPPSPTSARKFANDVFSRLTGGNSRPSSPTGNSGSITANTKQLAMTKSSPLTCTHRAEGHNKAVLSVYCTEDRLFTSSKDRTAKVWDLNTGQEVSTLGGHSDNVTVVRFNEPTGLVYTVSAYFIKVWDIRDCKCIKTLYSSGHCSDGPISLSTANRQVDKPIGETNINDISVSSDGSLLFTTAGSFVRIWDIRRYLSVGKLSGGHQAAVMALAVDSVDEMNTVVTGSKDHYIKVYSVPNSTVGVLTPTHNLEPPHYDGIQSLAIGNNFLYSGSRDTCIKQWNLTDNTLKQSVNSAHKDWVTGLALLPTHPWLLSCCRAGTVKVWNSQSLNQIGEIKAHQSPINAITANSGVVFTASNDHTVGLWRPASDFDADVTDRGPSPATVT